MKNKNKTKQSIVISIDRLPPSLNEYLHMHWSSRYELQGVYDQLIHIEWLKANKYVFTKPVSITFALFFSKKRTRDFDNYLGGTKPITDALKKTFLFRDDSEWVSSVRVFFMQGVKNGTIIKIEEAK